MGGRRTRTRRAKRPDDTLAGAIVATIADIAENGGVGGEHLRRYLDDPDLDMAVDVACMTVGPEMARRLRTEARATAAAAFLTWEDMRTARAILSLFVIPATDPDRIDANRIAALISKLAESGACGAGSKILIPGVAVTPDWLATATPGMLHVAFMALAPACIEAFETGRDAEIDDPDALPLKEAAPRRKAGDGPAALLALRLMPIPEGKCPCCAQIGDLLWGLDPAGAHAGNLKRTFESACRADPMLAGCGFEAPADLFTASSRMGAARARRMLGVPDDAPDATWHVFLEDEGIIVAARSGERRYGPITIDPRIAEAQSDEFVEAMGRRVIVHDSEAALLAGLGSS